MTIKSDFVTNSSSTSFIMIGWKIDIASVDKATVNSILFNVDDDEGEYLNLVSRDDPEQGALPGEILVGKHLASHFDDEARKIFDLETYVNDEDLLKFKEEFELGEMQIIVGTEIS